MILLPILAFMPLAQTTDWVVYEGERKNGKHIVFLAGDEEYRSEEGLPQMAKILAFRHGFKCTVLFSINEKGEIDPDVRDNQPGLENLKTADLVVMLLRFREWPDAQMKHFDVYLHSGKPIIALRTSTHAFDIKSGQYEKYGWQSKTWVGGFGKQVLGETWVSHWGLHGKQGTRAHKWHQTETHLVFRGVDEIFVTTDVYEAHPQANLFLRGEVVDGLKPTDPPAQGKRKNSLGREHEINDPMMPIAWVNEYLYDPPNRNRVFVTTMGAATDLLNEGLRRLLVNSALWLTGLEVPMKADVALVGEYKPSNFGFGGFKKGVKPSDLAGEK
jgi:hypothetical protein